jgi:glycosyltransferase involved in cell wall biosynthesis
MNKVYIKPNFTFQDDENFKSSGHLDYFLFVGRVEPLKGIGVVIKAFEKMPDQRLVVAGDGPLMDQMKSYTKVHKMTNVEFAGYLSKQQLQEKYRKARAVIMSSQCYEAFAMTIAEAYSYGVPVIAGDIGNLRNMVDEGNTGLRFKYDSPADIVNKVRAFNRMDIATMKQNARQFYANRLRPEDNYRILEEIYRNILEDNRSEKDAGI